MIARFYAQYSRRLLILTAISFPFLLHQAESMPLNNDIETWLPSDSDVRITYDRFKQRFGIEEIILVGLSPETVDTRLQESVCRRLEGLAEIRKCWSPDRFRSHMQELGVPDDVIDERLNGFAISRDGSMVGMIALLSDAGHQDRVSTVHKIQQELEYCQLRSEDIRLAGSPVIVAELDKLGSPESNKKFQIAMLVICLGLLYYAIRDWKLSAAIFFVTVWSIQLTLSIVKWCGGEMNFILGALAAMVMIFTLAVSIHFLHYFQSVAQQKSPLTAALRLAWKPCCLATLTTTIGLLSLTLSEIGPVIQFGYAASVGCIVSLFSGLGLTPALLTIWPLPAQQNHTANPRLNACVDWLVGHHKQVTLVIGSVVAMTCVGMVYLESRIDPRDFLPKSGKVMSDLRQVEQQLITTTSVEATVDFGHSDLPFLDKLDQVRALQHVIDSHPAIGHTMSLANFFPPSMSDSTLPVADVLDKAQSRSSESNDYVSPGQREWRISARLVPQAGMTRTEVVAELSEVTAGAPITFTGIAPLLDQAQRTIFTGFWESFSTAFIIISLVMIAALRSFKVGMIAMIPNLTPLCLVYGVLGWIDFPIDIGMMMSGSIALGIAVDGTFHFIVRYQESFRKQGQGAEASRVALLQTGTPIFQAAVIASIGMIALTLSPFTPTARFGFMMATLLIAALVGDLVLLPAVLSFRKSKKQQPQPPKTVKLPRTKRIDSQQGIALYRKQVRKASARIRNRR